MPVFKLLSTVTCWNILYPLSHSSLVDTYLSKDFEGVHQIKVAFGTAFYIKDHIDLSTINLFHIKGDVQHNLRGRYVDLFHLKILCKGYCCWSNFVILFLLKGLFKFGWTLPFIDHKYNDYCCPKITLEIFVSNILNIYRAVMQMHFFWGEESDIIY